MSAFSSGAKRSTVRIALMGLFAALSIVFGKFLAINLGEFIRFSFENFPILLAGMALGPIAGGIVGATADLLGCVLVGFSINPIITAGAVLIGVIGGGVRFLPKRFPTALSICLTVGLAHLIGSILVKTVGLSVFYGLDFFVTLLWRALNYLLIAPLEIGILVLIFHNKTILLQIERLSFRAAKGKKP